MNNHLLPISEYEAEPIKFIGFTQPHGVFLAIAEPELTILQVSNNTLHFLGFAPEDLLNQPLSILIDNEQINIFRDYLSQQDLQSSNPIEFPIKVGDKNINFDGVIHRSDNILILELEPTVLDKNQGFFKFYPLIKLAVSQLKGANNLPDLCQILAKEVRKITGFDRVMLYKFDDDGHGSVIAEEKLESLESYLGLHYPESDIPRVARELFTSNYTRLIPDTSAELIEIIPYNNPLINQPTDLTNSMLRSAAPCHIQYLHNMGVGASLTISLIKDQKLWGLIACHHQSQKYLPYEIRSACEILGQMASLELANKEDNEDSQYKIYLASIQAKLVEYMSIDKNFIGGLINNEINILNLVNAQGAVICFDGEYIPLGNTPKQKDIQKLVQWISENLQEAIFYTNNLYHFYPDAEKFQDLASGLLVVSISRSQKNYILWFRPEVLQTVDWGGNPYQSLEIIEQEDIQLLPRKSFELWKEIVQLKSLPWKSCEISAALELRNSIIGVILRKVDELELLNRDLERSNNELDSFAYIASHDLKEPLRGIHNYSNFLIEDYGETLNEDGQSKLRTLIRLTQRMEDLIDSLLHFARLGRIDLSMQQTDLNKILHNSIDLLSPRIEQEKIEIRIPKSLPKISCDRIQMSEVFNNLIANAIKYNDKDKKWIEIGYIKDSNPLQFYIKDNGIGIKNKHFDTIFRIFKRLHGPNKYGGGTGAGLTIVQKIVQKHGGKIWVESTYGEGSTFYFILQGDEL
ncbi:GAF domain-containing protein [Anabaena sp. UHCC 0187]|uniref:ATP-binding protein n=1 Tax=Anabaena sp. UHCC 0187 TaxID=2590018 RepID=UPI0014467D39|nr:ATP-binding protein [Anabaena sp. UHCC 0187]MTJ13542.1 GAF domain-containing protein [Anabaena sp. UHCC 0187]